MLLYNNVLKGIFRRRPNRFIAYVDINGKTEKVHVKNTGRCKELLVPGCTVYLDKPDNPNRKTAYDLVAVMKGDTLINMDSAAPNKVFGQWAKENYPGAIIKPEVKYKNSRFDFYIEQGDRKIFTEVKGVTLEENGIVKFPDAPTERGLKHIHELIDAVENGYEARIFFVVQIENVKLFTPNYATHRQFGEALKLAREKGVKILAYNCKVTPDSMSIYRPVEIEL